MRSDDDLDLLLDSALSAYADPGPDSGLERRVLVRISAACAQAPRRRWLLWVIALPCAACLFLLVLSERKQTRPPIDQTEQVRSSEKHPLIAAETGSQTAARFGTQQKVKNQTRVKSRPGPLAAESVALPKLDVFPTPHPLTAAERRLAVFAARAPESEREALIEAQKQSEEPLSIAAIHIPLLESPDEGNN